MVEGKDIDHRRDSGEERGLSEYSWDYFFPGDGKGNKLTVLGGKERCTGTYMAAAVPEKGSRGRYVVDEVRKMIEEVGDKGSSIIVKSDQEPAITVLIKDLIEEREEGRTVVEESPKGSSGSNGVVERGTQGIEGQMR